MRELIDLTGQRFGKLKVISHIPHIQEKGKHKGSVWKCICDCGREKDVLSGNLRSGDTKSCGCLVIRPRLAPSEHPSILDIAFVAGFYEGEGCCGQDHNRASFHVTIGQNDYEKVQWLKRFFGGHISDGHTPKGKVFYSWRLSGGRARGFLMTIYSFLSLRRKQRIREALDRWRCHSAFRN